MPAVFAALLTPFTSPAGTVDYEFIRQHLRWLERQGIDGVVPCGTTGEGPSLSFSERQEVIGLVMEHRGDLQVIPSTGCAALPDTVMLSRYAIDQGAEVVMIMPPFFFKGISDEGLLSYYQAICAALPPGKRVLLYHIPQITDVPITFGVIDGLLTSWPDRLYGVKDSGGDPDYTALLIKRYPQLKVFCGDSAHFAQALEDGAAGGIFALANVFPADLCAMRDADSAGRAIAGLQEQMSDREHLLATIGTVAALKALLPHVADLPAPSVRAPLVNLSIEEGLNLWDRISGA